uniref:Uncharacterized protein n=1 Tax=Anguilla anguilla TaxID=7936 RepID=A0A0E9USN0_ANGAN
MQTNLYVKICFLKSTSRVRRVVRHRVG